LVCSYIIFGGIYILTEEWKDIEGYEGFYQVSNLGRVKSLARVVMRSDGKPNPVNEKILKYGIIKGYCAVVLCKDRKKKMYKVHRLVAIAFLSNPHNLPEVNHKDENKKNNCVDNLEWCTSLYNINYGSHNERVTNTIVKNGSLRGENHPKSKKVKCDNKIFACTRECAEFFKVNKNTMTSWIRGLKTMPQKFVDMGLGYAD